MSSFSFRRPALGATGGTLSLCGVTSMIRFARLVAAVVLLALPAVAAAQTFVVAPNIYENAEGPGSNNALIRNLDNPRTVQIIFSSSQLTGLVNHNITGITYRLSDHWPNGYPFVQTTWTEYR